MRFLFAVLIEDARVVTAVQLKIVSGEPELGDDD